MSENQFFYMSLGIPRGPFSWDQFVELAKGGRIKSNTACILNDNPSQPALQFFGENWQKIQDYRQSIVAEKAAEIEKIKRDKAEEIEERRLEKRRDRQERELRQREQQAALEREQARRDEEARLSEVGSTEPPQLPQNGLPKRNYVPVIVVSSFATVIVLITGSWFAFVWISNRGLQEKLDSCPTSQIVDARVYYENPLSGSKIVFDYRGSKTATARRIDAVHLFLQFTEELDLYSVDELVLARYSEHIFFIDSTDLRSLTESYKNGGRVWAFNNMPSRLKDKYGSRAFEEWSGGWLGVMKEQVEDLNEMIEQWIGS